MIGVGFTFADGDAYDRGPVWMEIPAVPNVGETVVYESVAYVVIERIWYGTPHTWAAAIRLRRIP